MTTPDTFGRRSFSPLRLLVLVAATPLWLAIFFVLFVMSVAHVVATGEAPSKEGC